MLTENKLFTYSTLYELPRVLGTPTKYNWNMILKESYLLNREELDLLINQIPKNNMLIIEALEKVLKNK